MGEKKLVTFNLDEERKQVWEDEAETEGRSLSGFIRWCCEKVIAGEERKRGGGADHTEELSELRNLVQGVVFSVDAMSEEVGTIHREISISDERKRNIPNVVRVLPKRDEGSMTPEEIRGLTDMSELQIIQSLNHTEEQTGLVGHEMHEEESVRAYYREI